MLKHITANVKFLIFFKKSWNKIINSSIHMCFLERYIYTDVISNKPNSENEKVPAQLKHLRIRFKLYYNLK